VDSLTERRASKQVDLNLLLNQRIQKFCQEKRFWWREKNATITTAAGDATYDLSDSATATDAADVEEIIRVILFNSASDMPVLSPIFDVETRMKALNDNTQGTPTGWFIKPGAITTIQLTPVPDATYTLLVPYWAIPESIPTDAEDQTIPLIPVYLHHALVSGLKMDVFEFIFGPESQKYILARSEYSDGIDKAQAKNSWSQEKVVQFRSREDAVRST
jgi:hypothetical protein